MLRPTSPKPPMGMIRRVPDSIGAGSMTVSGMCPPSVAVFSSVRAIGAADVSGGASARSARDLRQRAAGGGVAVGTEVVEVDARHALHVVDLVLDEGGLPLFRADERKPHARAADAAEAVQDVLHRDGAGHVGHH